MDFTGQRLDGTGLHFYNARYYDSLLGRFISADTIVPGVDSQAYNRYAYVRNNPLRYTDPTGHCPWCVVVIIGVLILAPVAVAIGNVAEAVVGPAFGLSPDYDGVSTAQSMVSRDSSNAPALASSLAVQSQWCCGILDAVGSLVGSQSNGPAQITPDESGYFPDGIYLPNNPSASTVAMYNKMRRGNAFCQNPGTVCDVTDEYIGMGLAQNFGPQNPEYFDSEGQPDWNRHLNGMSETGYDTLNNARVAIRMILKNSYSWPRFHLGQFTRNLLALQEQGWELPEGLDTEYMFCLADAKQNGQPCSR